MATPSELHRVISECFGISESTVFQHDRELVKAGFRLAGGRGRYAVVRPVDAANLLIAIFGSPPFSPSIKETAHTVEKYQALPAWAQSSPGQSISPGVWQRTLPRLAAGHNFQAALAELITRFASGDFETASQIWPALKQEISLEDQAGFVPNSKPAPGLFDFGTIEVTVTITGPAPEAVIRIEGSTTGIGPGPYFEELRYFLLPSEPGVFVYPDWYQMRKLGEKSLRKISTVFIDQSFGSQAKTHKKAK